MAADSKVVDDTEVLITKTQMFLLQRPIEKDDERSAELWPVLLRYRARIESFFSKIRLRVIIDEAEEFAYLKQMENEDNENYPQLIPLREIDYLTSILLLLLRQILHEHDTAGREGRCVISREQLHDRMMLFLEDVANRAHLIRKINGKLSLVHEKFGVIRMFGEKGQKIEIKRSIKALITSPFAEEMLAKQKAYFEYAEEHFKDEISEPELLSRPDELLEDPDD